MPEVERRTLLSVYIDQFKSPLIFLLFAAGAVARVLGHVSDAVVILSVVIVNTVIGTLQEAERSLEALRRMTAHKARAVRDGTEVIVEARDLVPGDVLVLESGDAVSADARLLHGAALQLAEAFLTGESVPVAKDLRPVAPDTPLGDRRDMVYAGTHVAAGRARAVIVATGLDTELDHIAILAGAAQGTKTPLEKRVAQFGRYVIVAGILMFVAVVTIGLLRGVPKEAARSRPCNRTSASFSKRPSSAMMRNCTVRQLETIAGPPLTTRQKLLSSCLPSRVGS